MWSRVIRVGLIQAMPAGDQERDSKGRQWEQRTELCVMQLFIIVIIRVFCFMNCGNKGIKREHMLEMKAIRDKYDPYGGRAIGSREMLDIREQNMVVKCFMLIRVGIIRCGQWNIVEMKD